MIALLSLVERVLREIENGFILSVGAVRRNGQVQMLVKLSKWEDEIAIAVVNGHLAGKQDLNWPTDWSA